MSDERSDIGELIVAASIEAEDLLLKHATAPVYAAVCRHFDDYRPMAAMDDVLIRYTRRMVRGRR